MKTLSVMKLYSKSLGCPNISEIVKSLILTASGLVEFGRILISRAKGHEGIIRRPKVNRMEYPGNRYLVKHNE